MAITRITVATPDASAADQGALQQIANSSGAISRLGDFFHSIAGGARTAKVRMNTAAVQAEGAIAFSSFVANDTVTINGVLFTAKSSPSGTQEWAVGATDEACANNLYDKLIASSLDKIVGVVVPYRRGTVLLSSFVDADTVTINGLVFTGKTSPDTSDPRQFKIGGSDAKTAENLMNAITACSSRYDSYLGKSLLSVSRSTATLTINMDRAMTLAASAHATVSNKIVQILSVVGGQIGNLMTLAISAHGTKTDPTGGTEGTETIFAKTRTIL